RLSRTLAPGYGDHSDHECCDKYEGHKVHQGGSQKTSGARGRNQIGAIALVVIVFVGLRRDDDAGAMFKRIVGYEVVPILAFEKSRSTGSRVSIVLCCWATEGNYTMPGCGSAG